MLGWANNLAEISMRQNIIGLFRTNLLKLSNKLVKSARGAAGGYAEKPASEIRVI